MRQSVAVVTDSTASIPRELAYELGIEVVQLQLQIDGVENDEGRIPSAALADAMRANLPVATAPPDPGAFFWTYQGLASRGADVIVSIHMSGKMSETVEHARIAAQQVAVPVHVIDSETCGMSLGYTAIEAARTAHRTGDVATVVRDAAIRSRNSNEFIYVDTLEYLRRGGRIGAAQQLVGDALSIKPVLTLVEGEVAPLRRVRGMQKALKRLVDLAAERAGRRQVDVAIEHFAGEDEANRIVDRIRKKIPTAREVVFTEVSAIIGAHVGPGSVGITISDV